MDKTDSKKVKIYFNRDVLAARIRAARIARGFSQNRLAEQIGKSSASYLSNIENGTSGISIDALVDVANELDVSLDYLLGRDEFMKRDASLSLADIARTLTILYYLDGVDVSRKPIEVEEEEAEGGPKKKKIRQQVHICLNKGLLRNAINSYIEEVEGRASSEAFAHRIEDTFRLLKASPAWSDAAEQKMIKTIAQFKKRDSNYAMKSLPDEEIRNALLWINNPLK